MCSSSSNVQVGAEESAKTGTGEYACFIAEGSTSQHASTAHNAQQQDEPALTSPLGQLASASIARHSFTAVPQSPDLARVAAAALHSLSVPVATLQMRLLRLLMTSLGWGAAVPAWGTTHQERGILGAVVFDTFGFHIPAERMCNGRWRRRTNVGYISNMAVAPSARRCGFCAQHCWLACRSTEARIIFAYQAYVLLVCMVLHDRACLLYCF